MLCHCDIYRLNSSPFCHTIHFNTIYSAGFQCTCQENVTYKGLISRSSVDLVSHSLTLVFFNLIYVNLFVQYVTVLCMTSSLQILEKDRVEVLELLASPLGRTIWNLDIILWAICIMTSGYQRTTRLFRLYKWKIHDYQRDEFLIQAHIRIAHSQFNYLLLPGSYFQN